MEAFVGWKAHVSFIIRSGVAGDAFARQQSQDYNLDLFNLELGDTAMKTYLTRAVLALGLVSTLALAAAAPSLAEPTYHGYPLHDWYTTDSW